MSYGRTAEDDNESAESKPDRNPCVHHGPDRPMGTLVGPGSGLAGSRLVKSPETRSESGSAAGSDGGSLDAGHLRRLRLAGVHRPELAGHEGRQAGPFKDHRPSPRGSAGLGLLHGYDGNLPQQQPVPRPEGFAELQSASHV